MALGYTLPSYAIPYAIQGQSLVSLDRIAIR